MKVLRRTALIAALVASPSVVALWAASGVWQEITAPTFGKWGIDLAARDRARQGR